MKFPNLPIPFKTGAAVKRARILKFYADGMVLVQASAASDMMLAVCDSGVDLDSGDTGTAHLSGIETVEYGGNVAIGAPLTSDAVGRAITATAGQRIVGYAATAGQLGTFGAVIIAPGYLEPTPGVLQTISLALTDEMLTESDGAQSFDFAAALPTNAFILGYDARVTEAFTDGAGGVFTLDLGISGGDLDQLADGLALGAIANLANAPGIRPTGKYGAITLAATVLADVNVDTATAGAAVAEVAYVVPGA